ncbi:Transmembrane protein [Trichostrongylus colubriformis]|uniref:Transmembrane protein n=1 Tax=Trichostrongylus colubriformis TaxID=6319 RepID=A0AAN8FML9_TRICO
MPADCPSAMYSPMMGFLYVFNLIVGTGALALPKAFQGAGYALSIVVLFFSAFISYIAATFVVESLSIGNAVSARKCKEQTRQQQSRQFDDVVITEESPSSFEINEKIEVGRMASMFLGRAGVILTYLALSIYLFGDLAIYSTTVPKSLMNVICAPVNTSNVMPMDPCRKNWPLFFHRFTVYRLCIILFVIVVTPMVIIGIQKTKYLQLATTICRWTAFTLMIVLAVAQIITSGPSGTPPAANIHGFGSLFGVTVYAFMCHHSLPALVTPMKTKSLLFFKLSGVFLLVLAFYFTLSITGSFAFSHVQDVYTLNFLHDDNTSVFYFICDHFLALFPVFTCTTNYPILATTLINNIRVLRDTILPPGSRLSSEEESLLEDDDIDEHDSRLRSSSRTIQRYDIIIPVVVIGVPTVTALLTDNVLLLATITGSYPGVAVQFLIPCSLVLYARKHTKNELKMPVPKKHASPFTSNFWPYAIVVWSFFAIIMVTLNVAGVKF